MENKPNPVFADVNIGQARMFQRVGTAQVYPRNDETKEAVCQLEWAYQVLREPSVPYPLVGKTSHESANQAVELHEDTLLNHLHIVP